MGRISLVFLAASCAFGCAGAVRQTAVAAHQPVASPPSSAPESRSPDELGRKAALDAAIRASLGAAPSPSKPADALLPIPALERGGGLDEGDDRRSHSHRLPAESVRRVVRQSAGRFRSCYERALLRDGTVRGRFVARFTIGRDGRVWSAREESTSLPDREARQCLLQTFFDLVFPEAPGQSIAVSYPLIFQRDGDTPPSELPSAPRIPRKLPPGFEEAMRSGKRVDPPVTDLPPATEIMEPVPQCPAGDPMCSEL